MSSYAQLKARLEALTDKEAGAGADTLRRRAAEEALGVTFPPDLDAFFSDFGWLALGPHEIHGLGSDVPPYLDLVAVTLAERAEFRPALPYHLVPLKNDGGGNLYSVDTTSLRADMVLHDHEMGPTPLDVGFVDWLKELAR